MILISKRLVSHTLRAARILGRLFSEKSSEFRSLKGFLRKNSIQENGHKDDCEVLRLPSQIVAGKHPQRQTTSLQLGAL